MTKWKKLSITSKGSFLVMILLTYIYSRMFIEDGKLDFTDRIFLLLVIIVFAFVGIISSINLTSQNGKKLTTRTVIGAVVTFCFLFCTDCL